MKKTIMILILITMACSVFATNAFIGFYYGKATFDYPKFDTMFEDADNISMRLHFLLKENPYMGLSVNMGGITKEKFKEQDNNATYTLTQTMFSVQYTPHYYHKLSDTMGVYVFGGPGIGAIKTNVSVSSTVPDPAAELESAISYSWVIGAKFELLNFAIDALYEQTSCEDKGIETGNNTFYLGASMSFADFARLVMTDSETE